MNRFRPFLISGVWEYKKSIFVLLHVCKSSRSHRYIPPLSSIKTNPDCVKWVIHWSILSIHKWKIILLPSCAYYVFDLKRKVWLKSILKCSWMFDLAHNFQVQWCSSGLIIGPWLYHTEMKSAFIFHQLIFLKSKEYQS